MARLGRTDLDVFPLCLGGNVFGWTADERKGLHADTIRAAVEDSLRRLQTDVIDLYYAHGDDDASIPLEETLGTFDELVRAGKVRYVAASNYEAPRLAEALALSEHEQLAGYVALQPEYNLLERAYERELAPLCVGTGLACVPYFSLAMGFLTGKYRPGGPSVASARAEGASRYLRDGGPAVLAALDEVAAAHGTTVAAVSLAWLLAQPTVAAPIASARTPAQLAELLPFVELDLGADELERLGSAG